MRDFRKELDGGCCKPSHGCNAATTCMCGLAEEAIEEVEKLRAALEPFRKVAEAHDVWGADRDGSPMLIEHCEGGQEYDITLGDLRRVREILNSP